jgi:glycerol uptake facilitator-like aquaporin
VFLIGYLAANKLGNIIPVAVGLWVFAAASFTQTGAQANPAVTFGLMYHGQGSVTSAWLILAQLAGAAIAMVFLIVFAAKTSKPAKKKAAKK